MRKKKYITVLIAAVACVLAGCTSNMPGHDPAAVLMDGVGRVTTDEPVSVAAYNWWWFINDAGHVNH